MDLIIFWIVFIPVAFLIAERLYKYDSVKDLSNKLKLDSKDLTYQTREKFISIENQISEISKDCKSSSENLKFLIEDLSDHIALLQDKLERERTY